MSSDEKPIGAAKGKQPNAEALCYPPPPPAVVGSPPPPPMLPFPQLPFFSYYFWGWGYQIFL